MALSYVFYTFPKSRRQEGHMPFVEWSLSKIVEGTRKLKKGSLHILEEELIIQLMLQKS